MRCRQGFTRGQAGDAYKVIEETRPAGGKVDGPELVTLVRAGAVFRSGKLLERPIDITSEPSAAEPQTAKSEVA